MYKTIVTTSWDDGHKLDLRLAKLLKKYDLPGTFYIAPFNHELSQKDRLTKEEILLIGKDFEIGAHTLTHQHLSSLSKSEMYYEIVESKKYLEKLLRKKITSFCYPYGDYNLQVEKLVEKVGFTHARTTKRYCFQKQNTYSIDTSFHTFTHARDIHHIINFSKFNLMKIFTYRNWDVLAMDLFDNCLRTGSMFHIWGHSWEIEKNNDWKKLEKVFMHISKRKNVDYVTNGGY